MDGSERQEKHWEAGFSVTDLDILESEQIQPIGTVTRRWPLSRNEAALRDDCGRFRDAYLQKAR